MVDVNTDPSVRRLVEHAATATVWISSVRVAPSDEDLQPLSLDTFQMARGIANKYRNSRRPWRHVCEALDSREVAVYLFDVTVHLYRGIGDILEDDYDTSPHVWMWVREFNAVQARLNHTFTACSV